MMKIAGAIPAVGGPAAGNPVHARATTRLGRVSDEARLADVAALRSIYRGPAQVVVDKAIDHVDGSAREFIERSPLCVIATSDGATTDASPRGGPPGFVKVLGPDRIAFGDLTGNNRLDSFSNIVAHPAVGLLFLIPGLPETLRLRGTASLSTDERLRELCAVSERIPRTVVVIEVNECYLHCGAAFRRGRVWDPESWPAVAERPSPGAILVNHSGIDADPADVDAGLADYYEHGIWEVGGNT